MVLNERELTWKYEISDDAQEFANRYIDNSRINLIISPCSSHPKRNWSNERYAAVADYAVQSLDANIILCGGPSALEKTTGIEIEKFMQKQATNLIGKDTLKKFLALLKYADAIITPDSGASTHGNRF